MAASSASHNRKNEPASKKVAAANNKHAAVSDSKRNSKLDNTQENKDYANELVGVILVAAGLLFAVCLYFIEVSPFGTLMSSLIYGLVGIVGYAVPVILIVLGMLVIVKDKLNISEASFVLTVLAIFLLSVEININSALPFEGASFFEYCKNAYFARAINPVCGGFIAALLSYPFELLFGTLISNIVLLAAIVVILMVVTRFSIRSCVSAARKRHAIRKNNSHEKNVRERSYGGTFESDDDFYDYSHEDDADEPPFDFDVRASSSNKSKNGHKKELFDENEVLYELKPVDADAPPEQLTFEEISDADRSEENDVPVVCPPRRAGKKATANGDAKEHEIPPFDENGEIIEIIVYQRPPYTLLQAPERRTSVRNESPDEKARILVAALASFKVAAKVINISVGPTITRFELQLATGTRVRSITPLGNDIAMALAAEKVRIEAPIPGKSAVGIEVPNKQVTYVYLREIIESKEFQEARSPIAFALGKDIAGKIMTADLAKMPHLLIAGATGSGKSVCLNSIILSMIYKASPEDLRMILIDPKVVEFRMYANLPHLLVPVVTDKKKAASSLRWGVSEMERRYRELAANNARDITRYNQLQVDDDKKLPRIVIIIDELAELMMSAAKEVEESICRIAQLGRACGIHLIVATQRPSADIITGLIKANITSRIAFAVSDPINSKIILDCNGAENLVGNGDMLFNPTGAAKPMRIQCAFVSDEEVESITTFFERTQLTPKFDTAVDSQIAAGVGASDSKAQVDSEEGDVFVDALQVVISEKQASASLLQRRLRIGYNKASRLIDEMEQHGYISSYDGAKPRKVLITQLQFDQAFGTTLADGQF